MLSGTKSGVSNVYGSTSTNAGNRRWLCRCAIGLFCFLFVAFWIFIICFVSQPDTPLDIVVSDDYVLPDIKPRYDAQVNGRIPLLLHQMWKSKIIPQRWQSAHDSCTQLNSEYELVLWTDEMIYNFLKRHYPWFYRVFLKYPYHIQRVDVARYFILYHYGGVYLDMDASCRTPLREIIVNMTQEESVLLPMTDIYGVTNSFMVAAPRSSFFEYVIYELPNFTHGNYKLVRHTTIIFSTGPMFMSHCVTTFDEPETIHVMSLRDYDEQHFAHAKGGSWHSFDTEVVDLFHFHYLELLLIVVAVAILVLVCRRRDDVSALYACCSSLLPWKVCRRHSERLTHSRSSSGHSWCSNDSSLLT